jgi:peptide/nickel transport system substrate-binding protein
VVNRSRSKVRGRWPGPVGRSAGARGRQSGRARRPSQAGGSPGATRCGSRQLVPSAATTAIFTVLIACAGFASPAAASSARLSQPATKPQAGGTASYALTSGDHFSWILPLENEANDELWNEDVADGMWVPLYFMGKGSATGIEYGLSIGKRPVYSDGDTTVTIDLNANYSWSDGERVTSTDVKFFFALDEAGKHTLGEYLPGDMPDDITSVTYPNAESFVLHLNHPYNPTWFTGNQLGWIYPLPAQSWDKTCATCPVGNAASTPAGAKAVFDFLFKQSEDLQSYPTDPLWKTVDGPWVISSYNAVTYQASFVANPNYTGPTPPRLAAYEIYTFTTDTSELNALRNGSITFGYVPLSDLSEISYFKSHGFTVEPWRYFYDEDIEFGYTSKSWGPLMKQLYVRQALQHLVTENLYIKRTLGGYGIADYGVIADYPGSAYVSPALKRDPDPYSPKAAEHLLAQHGWKTEAHGTDVCMRPGAGKGECGAGIPKGKKLSFPFVYSTGTTAFFAQVSAFQTSAKKVGIDITLDGQTATTMYSVAGVCPNTPPCNWGLAGYSGYMWDYGQGDIVPTGQQQFLKGNFWGGGYYTPKAQRLIGAAARQPGLRPLYAVETYLSRDVASLWWPLEDSVVVVKSNLKGWMPLSPYGTEYPFTWYFSG